METENSQKVSLKATMLSDLFHCNYIQKNLRSWGTWVANRLSNVLLISVQVMISRFLGSIPMSGSVRAAQSLLGILSLSLCPSPAFSLSLSLSLSLKINQHLKSILRGTWVAQSVKRLTRLWLRS